MTLLLQAGGPSILAWGSRAIALAAIVTSGLSGAADREDTMRVIFQTEGGIAHFPGLSRPVTIESEALPEQEAAELRELMGAARLLDRPAHVGKARRGAADYRQYTITVEAAHRTYTVRVTEPVDDPALQRLIQFLQEQAKALRANAPSEGSE